MRTRPPVAPISPYYRVWRRPRRDRVITGGKWPSSAAAGAVITGLIEPSPVAAPAARRTRVTAVPRGRPRAAPPPRPESPHAYPVRLPCGGGRRDFGASFLPCAVNSPLARRSGRRPSIVFNRGSQIEPRARRRAARKRSGPARDAAARLANVALCLILQPAAHQAGVPARSANRVGWSRRAAAADGRVIIVQTPTTRTFSQRPRAFRAATESEQAQGFFLPAGCLRPARHMLADTASQYTHTHTLTHSCMVT